MKTKLKWILIAQAVVCVVANIMVLLFGDSTASIIAFPFEQIGMGLRALSTWGAAGNAVAFVCYILFCLTPLAYFMRRMRKHSIHAEDGLLILLTIALFVVIYMMINPADIARHLGFPESVSFGKATFGVMLYSILAGYLILRALRSLKSSNTNSIFKYLRILLAAVCVALIFVALGTELSTLIGSLKEMTLHNSNTMPDFFPIFINVAFDSGLLWSYLSLILQYSVRILPFIFGIVIVFLGLDLVTALETDPYGLAVAASARKMGRACQNSIVTIILAQIGMNVLQFALGLQSRYSSFVLNIPLSSILFMMSAMLLVEYFEKARQLKRDNEMFI